ncbi:hypothetical protein B0H11DRAFT_2260332 [Mycena galericulata]|nr:hypothetical protein B0H11DRAFT_2260332 [Mycena galericulata]
MVADAGDEGPVLRGGWRLFSACEYLLDGEESKSLSAFPLPARQEFMGNATSSRNSSLERLRVHISPSQVGIHGRIFPSILPHLISYA